MSAQPLQRVRSFFDRGVLDQGTVWGLLVGLVMPLLGAWIYPTYRHSMTVPWVENSRLLEAPFVLCELLVVSWAARQGFELRKILASVPTHSLVAVTIMMVGVWGSTLLVSKVPAMSIMISLSTVVHLLFACSVFFLARSVDHHFLERFSRALAIGLVALVALTVWRLLLPPPLILLPEHVIEWGSALPGFISVRHFGTWTGALGALFAAHCLGRSGSDRPSWHEGAYFLAALTTIWSGTRAAVLAIALACGVMILSSRRLPNLRVLVRMAVLTLAALAANEWLLWHPSSDFVLFHSVYDVQSVDQFTSLRSVLWAQTYAKWLQAPWFGWGSGSTFWEVYIGWTHTQPHNFVLQFLISWGIVGASGAIWLLARATAKAQSCARRDPRLWPLNAALYSLLIQACLEGMLHYPRFIMMIMMLYALILRLAEKTEPNAVRLAQ